MMSNATLGYFTILDYSAYTRHIREPNRANAVILTLNTGNTAKQIAITSAVEEHFDHADIEVLSNFIINEEREEINAAFDIIAALLMIMTLLLATVGGLGLMGTMSLNVMERVREIGVMRAFGASSAAISRIVIVEGLLIGMISWILAIGLSLPISIFLARTIGNAFMDYPMPATTSPGGILIWAVMVIVISVIASLFPALRAVRLTVTEVLAYE
jgi:putative ABC transport system permease protein